VAVAADHFSLVVAQMSLEGGTNKRKAKALEDDEEEEEPSQTKKKKVKRVKDPDEPKRPVTAYLSFQNEIRKELKAQHPEISQRDLLQLIGKKWQDMPDEEKQVCIITRSKFSTTQPLPH
jgi:hypothetical protein